MLANILPGLREIRAPLAAGYLWFVTAWVLLVDQIETGSGATGSVDALSRLKESVGPGAIAAAITFLAYLIGALWQPLAEGFAEAAWLMRSNIKRRKYPGYRGVWRHADLIARGRDQYQPPFKSRISATAWIRLGQLGSRLFDQTDDVVVSKLRVGRDAIARFLSKTQYVWLRYVDESDDPSTERDVKELTFGSERDMWWRSEAKDLMHDVWGYDLAPPRLEPILVLVKQSGKESASVIRRSEITSRMFDDLSLTARRLVGEEQESFLELSRMDGEVEFRYALAIPVAVATSVITFGIGAPLLVWMAATIAGIVAGGAFLVDGWRRDRRRNDLIVELLVIGKAKSPTFEWLLERAQQAKRSGHAPMDETEASFDDSSADVDGSTEAPPELASRPPTSATATTSTGSSESSSLVSITRSVLPAPSGIVSPTLQFGTAVLRTGESAGVPSSCSSLKVKAIGPS